MSDIIHVLLADDHELVRSGIKAALRGYPEFSVVGEAADGHDAVRQAAKLKPELAVLDVRMPGLDGIEACREIRSAHPSINVLMLTSYADEKAVMAALLAGAGGFMLKEVRMDGLVEAMRIVGHGGSTLDPQTCATVIGQIRQSSILTPEERQAQQLNERELAVLDLIAEGLTNHEIGERLYLSEKTIKHHVSDILAKLGLTRRVHAATFATRLRAQRPDER
ncbi:MAG TPA: response regulator transcription factor [Tepidiformaceae bacterium]|nr:response regulator transcription factor [Tepidiformaceae bacterium]